jgi:hypothetical protein
MVVGFPAVHGLELLPGENFLHVDIVESTLGKLPVVSQVDAGGSNSKARPSAVAPGIQTCDAQATFLITRTHSPFGSARSSGSTVGVEPDLERHGVGSALAEEVVKLADATSGSCQVPATNARLTPTEPMR